MSRTAQCALLLLCSIATGGAAPRICELMYHPVGGANGTDGEAFEYVELCNTSSVPFDLSGARFTEGIEYTFPTGTVLVASERRALVRDVIAFTSRYPAVSNRFPGIYSNALANGGERVSLEDATGTLLDSVQYGDGPDWPRRADGLGASLQRDLDATDPDQSAAWADSDIYGGTPGTRGHAASNHVVINEVLAHTDAPLEDAIELHSLADGPLDLSGWYISDDVRSPRKVPLSNTVVNAGGYVAIYEEWFRLHAATIPGAQPFAIDSVGDEIMLTAQTDTDAPLRLIDAVAFGATENGASMGLYPDGTGIWARLAQPSFGVDAPADLADFRSGNGAANTPPLIGPVVISEIMYHPADAGPSDEYIELINISSNTVPLYDPGNPSNTWRLRSAVAFDLPQGIVLQPGEVLLVSDAADAAGFRARHGLSPTNQVLGPWSGSLSNGGESIRLYKPDSPNSNAVPYILVETIDYEDASPWPTQADGDGPSLDRVDYNRWGNNAANWFAGPSGGTPGVRPTLGLHAPRVLPATPLPAQAFTASVSVISATPPTQVVLRAYANQHTTNLVMRDDGIGPDLLSGDAVYTVQVPPQADGTWFHYQFLAMNADGDTQTLPSQIAVYDEMPSLTVRLSGGGFLTTVPVTEHWTHYESAGVATHSSAFYVYLNGPGEALVDDLSLVDTATGTEHVPNGDFESSSDDAWEGSGNHIASYHGDADDAPSNGVLHVIASDAGGSSRNSANCSLDPEIEVEAPGHLSFRVRTRPRLMRPWLWFRIGSARAPDVLINEIMYHPDNVDETLGEYVELLNTTAREVDIGGWELAGTGMTLPPGTQLAPFEMLVCCANSAAIAGTHGITNVIGDWPGILQNDGERIRLRNTAGRIVDEITYSDEAPWPVAPDGYGPSLERVSAAATESSVTNWATSRPPLTWQRMAWTSEISSANSGLRLYLDAAQKTWIDRVSVTPVGGQSNLLANGDFEMGLTNWFPHGNHDRTRVEPGMGLGGSNALALVCNQTRIVDEPPIITFGDPDSDRVQSDALATENGQVYEIALWHRRAGGGATLHWKVADASASVAVGNRGTPGRANSAQAAHISTSIHNMTSEWSVGPTGAANTVRAQITGVSSAMTAILHYRIVPPGTYEYSDGHYSSVAMADDGAAPDLSAGDGQFAGSLPAVLTNRTLLRYHVTVGQSNAPVARLPSWDDPESDAGVWVDSDPQQTQIPNWEFLFDGPPELYPVVRRACAVSPEGQVFIDVTVRQRGAPTKDPLRTGFQVKFNRSNLYDAWFQPDQPEINFRNRRNDYSAWNRRVVGEWVSYELDRIIGLAAPRLRHVAIWMNGVPGITVELESPKEDFAKAYGIKASDFLSREGYTGQNTLYGDESINNLDAMGDLLDLTTGADIHAVIRQNLAYESVRHALAFLNIIADGDQNLQWNMMQHRSAKDGRWRQYPWDLDVSFRDKYVLIHPYSNTPEHPGIYGTLGRQAMTILWSPESGTGAEHTLPYRYRHQRTLWRYCHTFFTTNYLHPKFDHVQAYLLPAYQQIGVDTDELTEIVDEAKQFVVERRDFYMTGTWSDRRSEFWSTGNVYNASNVAIAEVMADPVGTTEYIELMNTGTQTIDMSWWQLDAGGESHRLPHGTMLGPTSRLVIADSHSALTNGFSEWADAARVKQRFWSLPIWDEPIVWTSATEYASRVVEVPGLTLPRSGTRIELRDIMSNTIDRVTYSNAPPWPLLPPGVALERIDPHLPGSTASAWRASSIMGTPGSENSASRDQDGDGMNDDWETRLASLRPGGPTNIAAILPHGDDDHDSIDNWSEFIGGTDPATRDAHRLQLHPGWTTNGRMTLRFDTIPSTNSPFYADYGPRQYALDHAPVPGTSNWNPILDYEAIQGDGRTVTHTNPPNAPDAFYRHRILLPPLRSP